MATYLELATVEADDDLRTKVQVAVVIKAHSFLGGTPTAEQVDWARGALSSPGQKARELLRYMIADNKDATLSQIQGASDTAIQTAVDTAADALAV